jgi:hypothetical protein
VPSAQELFSNPEFMRDFYSLTDEEREKMFLEIAQTDQDWIGLSQPDQSRLSQEIIYGQAPQQTVSTAGGELATNLGQAGIGLAATVPELAGTLAQRLGQPEVTPESLMTKEGALNALSYLTPAKMASLPTELASQVGQFIPGLGEGGAVTEAMHGAADVVSGAAEALPQSQFGSIQDVDWTSPEQVAEFAAASVGQAAPSIAAIMLAYRLGGARAAKTAAEKTGLTGAALREAVKVAGEKAALATGIGMQTGGISQEMREETGSVDPEKALAGGVVSGYLEQVMPKGLMNQPAGKALQNSFLNWAKAKAGGVLKSAAEEGLTEGAQRAVERLALQWKDEEKEALTKEGLWEIADSAVRGAFGGGPFGAAARVPKRQTPEGLWVEDESAPPPAPGQQEPELEEQPKTYTMTQAMEAQVPVWVKQDRHIQDWFSLTDDGTTPAQLTRAQESLVEAAGEAGIDPATAQQELADRVVAAQGMVEGREQAQPQEVPAPAPEPEVQQEPAQRPVTLQEMEQAERELQESQRPPEERAAELVKEGVIDQEPLTLDELEHIEKVRGIQRDLLGRTPEKQAGKPEAAPLDISLKLKKSEEKSRARAAKEEADLEREMERGYEEQRLAAREEATKGDQINALKRRVKELGGISAPAIRPDGSKREVEEYRRMMLDVRRTPEYGGRPLDERRATLIDEGYIDEDVTDSDLREILSEPLMQYQTDKAAPAPPSPQLPPRKKLNVEYVKKQFAPLGGTTEATPTGAKITFKDSRPDLYIEAVESIATDEQALRENNVTEEEIKAGVQIIRGAFGSTKDSDLMLLDRRHAGVGTFQHETFHWAAKHLLSDVDYKTLTKKYEGGKLAAEEAMAEAYRKWKPGQGGVFQKLHNAVVRTLNAVGIGYRDSRTIFNEMAKGKLEPRKEPAVRERAAAPEGKPEPVIPGRKPTPVPEGKWDKAKAPKREGVKFQVSPPPKMGLKRYLERSKIKKALYHGTPYGGFNEVRLSGEENQYGPGFYLTDSPELAGEYALQEQKKRPEGVSETASPATMQMHARIINPFNINEAVDAKPIIKELGRRGISEAEAASVADAALESGERVYEELEILLGSRTAINDLLLDAGYDGITHIGGYGAMHGGKPHQVWVAFDESQVKSATANVGTYDRWQRDIRYQVSEVPAPAKKWYSKLEKVVSEFSQKKWAPEQLIRWVQKQPGVTAEELEWSGLKEYLQAQKGKAVNKDEVVAFLKANGVQVQESVAGQPTTKQESRRQELKEKQDQGLTDAMEEAELRKLNATLGEYKGTKYDRYALPGGENYRELVLTLPVPDETVGHTIQWNDGYPSDKEFDTESEANKYLKAMSDAMGGGKVVPITEEGTGYMGPHFDPSNVLASIRFDERTDANGKKVLFIEEIQSDWHQEGRKKGYAKEKEATSLPEGSSVTDEGEFWRVTLPRSIPTRGYGLDGVVSRDTFYGSSRDEAVANALATINGTLVRDRVPDAPFKGNEWINLGLKRMIRWAAENDFDAIGWTTGEQQAERYDLSKQVGEISYDPTVNGGTLIADDVGGRRTLIDESGVAPDGIEKFVGKEVAEKLLNNPTERDGSTSTVRGLDLKVGGEGMKVFYDQALRNTASKMGKKYGARVGQSEITTRQSWDTEGGIEEATDNVHSLPITPEMKAAALGKGMPTFGVKFQVAQPAKKGERQTFEVPEEMRRDRFTRWAFEKYHWLGKLGQHLAESAGMTELAEAMDAHLHAGNLTAKIGGTLSTMERRFIEPMQEVLGKYKIKLEEFDSFLHARHAFEANAKLEERHITGQLKGLKKQLDETQPYKNGQWIKAPDRGNFGRIVGIHEGKVRVKFVNPETKAEAYKIFDEAALNEVRKETLETEIAELERKAKEQDFPHSGLTDEEAQEILDDFRGRGLVSWKGSGVDATEYTGKMAEAAEFLDQMHKMKLELLKAAGVITQQDVENLENAYQYYVPTKGLSQGVMDDILGADRVKIFRDATPGLQQKINDLATELAGRTGLRGRGSKGVSTQGTGMKQRLGRGDLEGMSSPLAQSVADVMEAIVRAEKNKVGQAFLRMVERFPNPELWTVHKGLGDFSRRYYDEKAKKVKRIPDLNRKEDANMFGVRVGGEQYYVQIKGQPGLVSALKNLGPAQLGPLTKMMGNANRALAKLYTTYSPEFVLSNLFRDLQTAGIVLNTQKETQGLAKKIRNEIYKGKGLRSVWKGEKGTLPKAEQKLYDEYKEAGGKVSFWVLPDIEQQMNKIAKGIESAGSEGKKLLSWAKNTKNFVEDVNGAVEGQARFATYKVLRGEGFSPAKAARFSRRVTVDFNASGEIGPAMGSWFIFANATMQGGATIARLAYNNPKKFGGLMGSAMALGMMMAQMNRMMSGEDEDEKRKYWDRIPHNVKARHLIFMNPFSDTGAYLKIPLPYGFNVPFAIGTTVVDAMHGSIDPTTAVAEVAGEAISAFNPMGEVDFSDWKGTARSLSPGWAKPLVEINENRNFWGGPVSPEDVPFARRERFGYPEADSHRHWNSTNKTLVDVAQWVNKVTRGDKRGGGWLDVSPANMEHFLKGYGGGPVKIFLDAVNLAHKGAINASGGDAPVKAREIPGFRKFVGEQAQYLPPQEFKSNVGLYDRQAQRLKDIIKERPGEVREFREEWSWLLRLGPRIKSYDKRIAAARKREDKALVEKLQKQVNRMFREAEDAR